MIAHGEYERFPLLSSPNQPNRKKSVYPLIQSISMLQQFKTNINCGSCVRSVTGFLDTVPGVMLWRVDVDNPDKILSVEGKADEQTILAAVREAGFDIEPVAV